MIYTPGFRLDEMEWTEPPFKLPKGWLNRKRKQLARIGREIEQEFRREAERQIAASLSAIELDRQSILEMEQQEKFLADRRSDWTNTLAVVDRFLKAEEARQAEYAAWRKNALAKLEEANKAITRSERAKFESRGLIRGSKRSRNGSSRLCSHS